MPGSPCCCWTSTCSSRSTMRWGTPSATGCWARWRRAYGPHGFVARLGGDEFGVLAPRLADLAAARRLAETVAGALAEPVTLDGLPLDVTAAIGIALCPEHGTDHLTLLRHADVAMY